MDSFFSKNLAKYEVKILPPPYDISLFGLKFINNLIFLLNCLLNNFLL